SVIILSAIADGPDVGLVPDAYNLISLVLAGLAGAGAITAIITTGRRASPLPPPRPHWRVTIAGGIAVLSTSLSRLWRPDAIPWRHEGTDFYLYIGLTFLAIGVVVGALAGLELLRDSLAGGLMLDAFAGLVIPSV